MSDYLEYNNARFCALLGALFAALDIVCWALTFTAAPSAVNPAVALLLWVIGLEIAAAVITVRKRRRA